MNDPLDFFDRDFSCDDNHALKNTLRERTTHALRVRRWRRRLTMVGAAAACYLAGLATMWLLPPRTVVTEVLVSVPQVIAEKKIESAPEEEPAPELAIIYKWRAEDDPANRVANFLKAGNLYLEQENNYAAALRCYSQAFDAGGAQVLEFSADDNWLVMELKSARRKGNSHVQ